MTTVVLKCVFRWQCPDCGAVNYAGCVPVETTPEERATFLRQHGIDEEPERMKDKPVGYMAPEEVACLSCEREFPAMDEIMM